MQNITLSSGKVITIYTPIELKSYLDKFVIGQEKAKKTICTAVYNHYKRLLINDKKSTIKIDKSNVILAGSTGSGKTFMIKKLAEHMGVPYYIGDATSITQAGYVGDDVETLLTGLLRATDYDVELAQCGIVIIDEIDKLAKRNSGPNLSGKDPVGEGVQQALLKIVEGNVVGVPPVPGRKHPEQQLMYVDTTNILFIGSGAFAGIEDIVKDRINPTSKIGFTTDSELVKDVDENTFDYLCQDDIRAFGFIPEFVGRFPVITNVSPLTKEELATIITEPEGNILDQYVKLFKFDNIKMTITDAAVDYIAETAINLKTGARAIRSIMECVMEEYMFSLPGSDTTEICINLAYAKDKISKRYRNIKTE